MIWTCPLQMTVVSKLYVDDFHGFHEIFTKMSLHMLLKFHYKLSNIVVRVCVNCGANTPHNMGLDARKPVFGISNKVGFKLACPATETS